MNSSGLFFSYNEVRLKLESWCAYQDRCEFDVRKKINSFDLSDEETEQLVAYLKETKFLDDARFLESFVSGKVRIKRWGRNKIKAELFQKKLPSKAISDALKEIDEDLYWGNLISLLDKKINLLTRESDPWKKKQKVIQFLVSKGYELDLIQDAYRELAKD